MTYREVYEGTDKLASRKGLTESETRRRLCHYYPVDDVNKYMDDVKVSETWTDADNQICVVYNKYTDKYIIIATGKHYLLIKP